MTVTLRWPTEQERASLAGLTAEQMIGAGWTIRSGFYHPIIGDYRAAAWIHPEQAIGPVEIVPEQWRWLAARDAPGIRWWDGEHENNGMSWTGPGHHSDGDHAWTFGVREIYEFIDIELPHNQRFRTLRYELQIYRGEENLGVIPLSPDRWYALAEMALIEGRRATEAGL